jgi:hypothetical protein
VVAVGTVVVESVVVVGDVVDVVDVVAWLVGVTDVVVD